MAFFESTYLERALLWANQKQLSPGRRCGCCFGPAWCPGCAIIPGPHTGACHIGTNEAERKPLESCKLHLITLECPSEPLIVAGKGVGGEHFIPLQNAHPRSSCGGRPMGAATLWLWQRAALSTDNYPAIFTKLLMPGTHVAL